MADKKISALTGATTPLAGTEVLPIVQGGSTVKVSIANVTAGRAVSAAQLDVDNIRLDANTISTTNTNGNLTIDPNGTGFSILTGPTNGTIAQMGDVNSRTFYMKQAAVGGFDNDTLIFESDSGVGQFQWKNSGATLWSMNRFGNLAPATAGTGIDFSANTNAPGMTSELLDWYEEGTWAIADVSGAGLSLTVNHAKYTRVGNLVTINAYVTYPATADVSAATLSLPFSAAAYDLGSAGASNGAVFSIITTGGTNAMSLRSSSLVSLTNAAVSGANVLMSFTYMV